MKVGEVLELLARCDPESEIILQKDAEGNGFSPLKGIDQNTIYISDSTWSGDCYDPNWNADDADCTPEEWAEMKAKPRVVLFHPVN